MSSLLWASIFPFENWGQVEAVANCQGVENSIAQGFEAHPWSLTAWVQSVVPLLTMGVALGQVLAISAPQFPPL